MGISLDPGTRTPPQQTPEARPGDGTAPKAATAVRGPRTLAIDIGGTGLKAILLDVHGAPICDRARVPTPRPATPEAIVDALQALVAPLGRFDRISVGFPGVVWAGTVKTAPNLDPSWAGVDIAQRLATLLGRPTRVLNDAGVQGLGVIEGHGLEMVLTLGTGLGCGLFYDGRYIPNLELGHHPFRKGKTYEEYLGAAALHSDGAAKWNKHLGRAIEQITPVWNPDRIYLGGGNARHVVPEALPPHVRVAPNVAGLLGGIALWEGREGLEMAKIEKAARTAHPDGAAPSDDASRAPKR
jgi:polyphosphate glucokinase